MYKSLEIGNLTFFIITLDICKNDVGTMKMKVFTYLVSLKRSFIKRQRSGISRENE